MGRFSDMKDRLANAKDAVHIKVLEAQLEKEEKKKEKFEKTKQDFLAQLAKYAAQSGQPATIFEEGKWFHYIQMD
jgi:hypothetical protein